MPTAENFDRVLKLPAYFLHQCFHRSWVHVILLHVAVPLLFACQIVHDFETPFQATDFFFLLLIASLLVLSISLVLVEFILPRVIARKLPPDRASSCLISQKWSILSSDNVLDELCLAGCWRNLNGDELALSSCNLCHEVERLLSAFNSFKFWIASH